MERLYMQNYLNVHLNCKLNVGDNNINKQRFQRIGYQNSSGCLCHSNNQRITRTLESVR